jgi:hypothetical protein
MRSLVAVPSLRLYGPSEHLLRADANRPIGFDPQMFGFWGAKWIQQ